MRDFHATFIDVDGTGVSADHVSCGGGTTLEGDLGRGRLRIPFENIARIDLGARWHGSRHPARHRDAARGCAGHPHRSHLDDVLRADPERGVSASVPAISRSVEFARRVSRGAARHARRVAFLLQLLAALAIAPPADALDVKLWPFFRYARNDDRGELRWSALGPLIEYVRTPELRDLRIRPLLWLSRRLGDAPEDRMEVLFPILSARRQANHHSLAPPAAQPQLDGAPHRRSGADLVVHALPLPVLAPGRRQRDAGGILPFYLDLADVFGYDRVRTVLFPAYLASSTESRVERRFYGFPFVSTVGGPDGSGWRVWPFYGNTAVAGRERERFVARPVYIDSQRLVPDVRLGAAALVFPAYAALDSELRTSRGYGRGSPTRGRWTSGSARGHRRTLARRLPRAPAGR